MTITTISGVERELRAEIDRLKKVGKLALEVLTGNWRTEEEMNDLHDKQMQAIAAMLAVLAEKPPMASMENT